MCDDGVTEQLNWGSIDDEDGAFGQISVAAVTIEDTDPELPVPQPAQAGKAIVGGASGSSPGLGSTFTPLEWEELDRIASAVVGSACSATATQRGRSNGKDPCALR